MNLQKTFFALAISFASFWICIGQERPESLILFDSVIEPNCEYLLNRLDTFAGEVIRSPNNIGHIVIQGGANAVQNKFYGQYVKNYFKFRKFGEKRFILISAKPVEKLKIDFVISSGANAKINVIAQDFSYSLPVADEPVLFVRNTVEVEKFEGELNFFDDCPACCIETVNLYFLSEFLKANPRLNARIKIYSKNRKRAK